MRPKRTPIPPAVSAIPRKAAPVEAATLSRRDGAGSAMRCGPTLHHAEPLDREQRAGVRGKEEGGPEEAQAPAGGRPAALDEGDEERGAAVEPREEERAEDGRVARRRQPGVLGAVRRAP